MNCRSARLRLTPYFFLSNRSMTAEERGIYAASTRLVAQIVRYFRLLAGGRTLKRHKCRARALGSERAPEGESPSLAVLPARQLKVTASRQRDVESNRK